MSQQKVVQHRPPSINGFDRRRADRDNDSRADNRFVQPARFHLGNSSNTGISHGSYNYGNSENTGHMNNNRIGEVKLGVSKGGGSGRFLHERMLFMTTCLIGQPVEVQVKNGSIFSGIFHATNAERDYGVILKMARLTKDGSIRGGKSEAVKDAANNAPIKTLIILAKDLVQVIAKDVLLTGDELANDPTRENRHDSIMDSFLSQAHHVELERELQPWTPDKDAPESLGLEDTFQNTWNRNWDQFETNKALFGVKSTFDEELYTTKLERGPQMRDLEREASRIAREIEGQVTRNFHLAEERGMRFEEALESLDEESRYSSVLREEENDIDEDGEDMYIDNRNEGTFDGDCFYIGVASSISNDGGDNTSLTVESENRSSQTSQTTSAGSSEVGGSPCESPVSNPSPIISSDFSDQMKIQSSDFDPDVSPLTNDICRKVSELSMQEKLNRTKQQLKCQANDFRPFSESLKNKAKVFEPCSSNVAGNMSLVDVESAPVPNAEKSGLLSRGPSLLFPPTAVASSPPASALPLPTGFGGALATSTFLTGLEGRDLIADTSQSATSSKVPLVAQPVIPHAQMPLSRMGSSNASVTDFLAASSSSTASISSRYSSVGSVSLEKSTLNPHAKEFKLNPNAKSFIPYFAGLRPSSPVAHAPIFMPNSIPPVAHMQTLTMGLGTGTSIQPPIQPVKFGQCNNATAAAGVTSTPYLQPVSTFSQSGSNTTISMGFAAQSAIKISPGQQMGQSFNGHQPVMYSSQALPLQPPPSYIHPNGQLCHQQMMPGHPGQVVYMPSFPQEMMQGPPIFPPQAWFPTTPNTQQVQQAKQRGAAV